MEIFGIGPAELVLILVVVLVIFGPDQLPEIAKKMGGAARDLRQNLDAMSSEVNDEVQSIKEIGAPLFTPPKPPRPDNLIVAESPANPATEESSTLSSEILSTTSDEYIPPT